MQKKKTAIIAARMTPEDKQKIEQRAANAGMTVTDYLTTCALGKKSSEWMGWTRFSLN